MVVLSFENIRNKITSKTDLTYNYMYFDVIFLLATFSAIVYLFLRPVIKTDRGSPNHSLKNILGMVYTGNKKKKKQNKLNSYTTKKWLQANMKTINGNESHLENYCPNFVSLFLSRQTYFLTTLSPTTFMI